MPIPGLLPPHKKDIIIVNVMTRFIDRYRYSYILLKQLVKTDFKLRYQSSLLGYLWSVLKPLFLFMIMYLVFVKVLNIDFGVENSGAYLLVGLVIWGFFTEMTGGSVGSIVGKGDLLRKLNFPRYTIVLATGLSALINLTINMVVVFVFIFVGGSEMHFDALLSPVVFLELFAIGMALAFFLSALYVRLRDIGYVWDVVLQAMFYATPIFFPITLAPLWAQKLLILNPVAQCLQDIRYLLVSHDTPTITTIYGNHWMRLVPVSITLLFVVIAAMYFRSRSKYFAEEI